MNSREVDGHHLVILSNNLEDIIIYINNYVHLILSLLSFSNIVLVFVK